IVRIDKNLIFEKACREERAACDISWKIETQLLDAALCDFQKFKSKKTRYVEWFDADKVIGILAIRHRKRGDSFWPIGLAASKKIGKFLTDAHIDSETRKSACVVEDSEKIIWLAPLRASEETKVTAATKSILQITCLAR
ncbi:MAG: tRNA lysidine(34) synthetase TilS, partial [Sedimentisphaerales bacterium]|nr:tRNA lysidine(34) synthetase TilS [Sedimentisphaerales bacterium]